MKIAFVDDNELNRMVSQDMLEILFSDATIVTFSSAQEFLDSDIDTVDILLSDIDMPVMDGFTLFTKLREKGFAKPIIAVTALAVHGDREKMLLHGFNDYISKPIDMNELEKTLEKYI